MRTMYITTVHIVIAVESGKIHCVFTVLVAKNICYMSRCNKNIEAKYLYKCETK
jgi:hypothetical protein